MSNVQSCNGVWHIKDSDTTTRGRAAVKGKCGAVFVTMPPTVSYSGTPCASCQQSK